MGSLNAPNKVKCITFPVYQCMTTMMTCSVDIAEGERLTHQLAESLLVPFL